MDEKLALSARLMNGQSRKEIGCARLPSLPTKLARAGQGILEMPSTAAGLFRSGLEVAQRARAERRERTKIRRRLKRHGGRQTNKSPMFS